MGSTWYPHALSWRDAVIEYDGPNSLVRPVDHVENEHGSRNVTHLEPIVVFFQDGTTRRYEPGTHVVVYRERAVMDF